MQISANSLQKQAGLTCLILLVCLWKTQVRFSMTVEKDVTLCTTTLSQRLSLSHNNSSPTTLQTGKKIICMFIDIPNTTNPNECGNTDNGLLCVTTSIAFFIYLLLLTRSIWLRFHRRQQHQLFQQMSQNNICENKPSGCCKNMYHLWTVMHCCIRYPTKFTTWGDVVKQPYQ